MALNYALLVVCGAYAIFGVIQMIRGTSMSRPLRTVGAIIVFLLAAAATAMGISILELKSIIESRGFK